MWKGKVSLPILEKTISRPCKLPESISSTRPWLKEAYEKTQVFFGVMTEKRQLLVINERFLDRFGIILKEDWLGLRPGNVVQCLHSEENYLGCGTSSACQNCTVIHALLKACTSKCFITEQVFIELAQEKEVHKQHFIMTILPYKKDVKSYVYLIYLEPIHTPLQ
jgi:hypothetical protein